MAKEVEWLFHPSMRVFNHVRYTLNMEGYSKDETEKWARYYRQVGHLARVVSLPMTRGSKTRKNYGLYLKVRK